LINNKKNLPEGNLVQHTPKRIWRLKCILQVLRPHSLLSPGDSENARKPPMHLASALGGIKTSKKRN
jgi:hypothetical protein